MPCIGDVLRVNNTFMMEIYIYTPSFVAIQLSFLYIQYVMEGQPVMSVWIFCAIQRYSHWINHHLKCVYSVHVVFVIRWKVSGLKTRHSLSPFFSLLSLQWGITVIFKNIGVFHIIIDSNFTQIYLFIPLVAHPVLSQRTYAGMYSWKTPQAPTENTGNQLSAIPTKLPGCRDVIHLHDINHTCDITHTRDVSESALRHGGKYRDCRSPAPSRKSASSILRINKPTRLHRFDTCQRTKF